MRKRNNVTENERMRVSETARALAPFEKPNIAM